MPISFASRMLRPALPAKLCTFSIHEISDWCEYYIFELSCMIQSPYRFNLSSRSASLRFPFTRFQLSPQFQREIIHASPTDLEDRNRSLEDARVIASFPSFFSFFHSLRSTLFFALVVYVARPDVNDDTSDI